MENILNQAMAVLQNAREILSKKQVTIGFDGCVDSVCRVVKRHNGTEKEYFRTMSEFGEYIIAKNGMSGSVELEQIFSKFGGNAPILSNTLGNMGISVNMLGMLGNPVEPEFSELSKQCTLYSYASNTVAIALEFLDGKFILAPKVPLSAQQAWKNIENNVSAIGLKKLFNDADLLCALNWSELDFTTELWNMALSQLAKMSPDKTKTVMFDLCDCNGRTDEAVLEILSVIQSFSAVRRVVFSLNDNEAIRIYEAFTAGKKDTFEQMIQEIAQRMNVDVLVVHTCKKSYSFAMGEEFEMETQFQETPKILTGGGDNFNAGYCLGLLLDQPPEICNAFGNAVSSYYIQNGQSPNIEDLKLFISDWINNKE